MRELRTPHARCHGLDRPGRIRIRHATNAALAVVAFATLVFAAACASSGHSRPRTSNNVITREELSALEVTTAYEAVERLRPHFLRGRGPTSIRNTQVTRPVVFVGGVRAGGPEALYRVLLTQVYEIRFLNAADATTRFGTDHAGGAILVTLM